MAGAMVVEAKQLGRRKRLWEGWRVPLPGTDGETLPLARLLEALVRAEVAAFRDRQAARRLPLVMSRGQIAEEAESGAVRPGAAIEPQAIDEDAAIRAVLEAFEDGLFYVFVDGEQVETLDAPCPVHDGVSLLLLRLVALAGG